MAHWLGELDELRGQAEDSVMVTVAGIRGSVPRETGAKMLVTRTATIGSIGGGQLEYQCTEQAAGLLGKAAGPMLRRYSLGANCGQCCGGVVEILFEPLPASAADWLDRVQRCHAAGKPAVLVTGLDTPQARRVLTGADDVGDLPGEVAAQARRLLDNREPALVCGSWLLEPVRRTGFDVAVFGAGHVGAATVDVLSRLDCAIRWIDSRRKLFPPDLPGNVTAIPSADPAREVAALPPGAFCLVMTHSHPLDLDICARLLEREDLAYCGLIGSRSKRRRFEKRLAAQGIPVPRLAGLVCPIGVSGVRGKRPAEIAIAVAAELLQIDDQRAGAADSRTGYLEVTG